jgi:hypothetical protein
VTPPKPGILQDREHLVAVAALFVAGLVAFLVVRLMLVPRDFGVYGHYRAGALADNQQRPLAYAGHEACEACHTDVAALHKSGRHARVACEACHGPLLAHAEDPEAAKGRRPEGRELCLGCHLANAAKPKSFPQVDAKEHAGDGTCLACHAPHRPEGEQGAKP